MFLSNAAKRYYSVPEMQVERKSDFFQRAICALL